MNDGWWAPYLRWQVVVCVGWLVLAVARVPVLADTAALPVALLPALLSTGGPWPGRALPVSLRVAALVGSIIWAMVRNPSYYPRGPEPPVWVEVPTRAEFWGQVAAFELLLLVVVEVAIISVAVIIARRHMRHRDR
ncbi:hypothetical protein [Demequina aestuarii]|uniref:hypothetical protein n=1 Tax=Demequina aestuarii TaxID=327095 RepID=UPI00128B4155|nr:hypothetical protein [Demequina aestuarii]